MYYRNDYIEMKNLKIQQKKEMNKMNKMKDNKNIKDYEMKIDFKGTLLIVEYFTQ